MTPELAERLHQLIPAHQGDSTIRIIRANLDEETAHFAVEVGTSLSLAGYRVTIPEEIPAYGYDEGNNRSSDITLYPDAEGYIERIMIARQNPERDIPLIKKPRFLYSTKYAFLMRLNTGPH